MSQVEKQHRWMRSCHFNQVEFMVVCVSVACLFLFIWIVWGGLGIYSLFMTVFFFTTLQNAVDSMFPWLIEPCQGYTLWSKFLEGFLVLWFESSTERMVYKGWAYYTMNILIVCILIILVVLCFISQYFLQPSWTVFPHSDCSCP